MLTDQKQTGVPGSTPFTSAQGGTTRPRVQTVKPVQAGNMGLSRPVMSNQDAAAARRGAANAQGSGAASPIQFAPQVQQSAPAASPIQPAPQSMIPQSLRGYQAAPASSAGRVSSAPNGPTPYSTVQSGNWWEAPPGTTQPQQVDTSPPGFLGSWATENTPLGQGQSQSQEAVPPNSSYDPSTVVRSAISNMKNSEIMQLLVDISNGRIRGRADD